MKQIICILIISFLPMLNLNAQETAKIKITVGANSFVATTYNNATAKAFVALQPMTITMNELNGNEKYFYLSGNLTNSPENPTTIHSGDLMLYGQNCLVLFYETLNTSYSYTKIGSIENTTGLKTALGPNNPTVTFELIGNTTGIGSIEQDKVELKISNDGLLQYNGKANKISLIALNGRMLSNSSSKVLNLNNFSRGVYLLKIEEQGQNQIRTIKFKY